MVVLGIVAILATLAMPSQLGRITQQRIVETLELIEPYKSTIENYYRLNAGNFPDDNDAAGMPEPNKILGNYLEKLILREGVMHLTLGQELPEQLHDKIISIRPVFVKDSPNSPISWICGLNDVPNGMTAAGTNLTNLDTRFLPGRCR